MNVQGVDRKDIVKKLVLTMLFSIASISGIKAQYITVEPYYENNIFGNQYGCILSWEFKRDIQIGGFYQFSLDRSKDIPVKYEFTGLYFDIPVYRAGRLSLSASFRSGIANDRFIIIVPGIETTFQIMKNFWVASVVSFRASKPSVGLKAVFKMY